MIIYPAAMHFLSSRRANEHRWRLNFRLEGDEHSPYLCSFTTYFTPVSVISNHSIYYNWSKISFVLIERSSNSNRSRQKSDFPEEIPRYKFDRVFLVPFLTMFESVSTFASSIFECKLRLAQVILWTKIWKKKKERKGEKITIVRVETRTV